MDLLFTPEDEHFRQEVRAFLEAKLPSDLRQRMRATGFANSEDQRHWQGILNQQGWAAPAWPKAWGGTGWTTGQQMIFADECALAPAPTPHIFNITMLGPVIIHFGNDEQRAFFLPKLLNGDILACQGFSEPGAGSDLASLSTSCKRVEGGWMVNGSKIWTSSAHYADWIFCLVRTDAAAKKKQAGISFVVIDLKSPGITIRPIIGKPTGREKLALYSCSGGTLALAADHVGVAKLELSTFAPQTIEALETARGRLRPGGRLVHGRARTGQGPLRQLTRCSSHRASFAMPFLRRFASSSKGAGDKHELHRPLEDVGGSALFNRSCADWYSGRPIARNWLAAPRRRPSGCFFEKVALSDPRVSGRQLPDRRGA